MNTLVYAHMYICKYLHKYINIYINKNVHTQVQYSNTAKLTYTHSTVKIIIPAHLKE